MRRRRRSEPIEPEIPLAADLIALGLGAGATPTETIAMVVAWAPPVIAEPFAAIEDGLGCGATFAQALGRAADETPMLGPLLRALLAAHHGAPASAAIDRLAADARATLRRRAETYARTIPTRLLFPLIALVLPAFALLSVVPAVIAGLQSL